jgi:ribokinase
VLAAAAVELDALVASSRDRGERYEPGDLDPPPRHVVRTAGSAGGEYETAGGERGRWEASPPPGPVSDFYGCGDSFAAGLTYGLGAGLPIGEALELGARCGAACATGRGPYEGQLREAN